MATRIFCELVRVQVVIKPHLIERLYRSWCILYSSTTIREIENKAF